MQILLLNGSARKSGRTYLALAKIAEPLQAEPRPIYGMASEIYPGRKPARRNPAYCGDGPLDQF